MGSLALGVGSGCGGKSSGERTISGSAGKAGGGGNGSRSGASGAPGGAGNGVGAHGGFSAATAGGASGTGARGGTSAAAGAGGDQATGGSSGKAGETTMGGRPSCDDVQADAAVELENIQRCMTRDQCGQVLTGTSCGCTRNLVARTDADAGRFRELLDTNCLALGSDCDCPPADGFACVANRCTWNYAEPTCTVTTPFTLCVAGIPLDSGDALEVGMPLTVTLGPSGCYSSSCTTVEALYTTTELENGNLELEGDLCLGTAPVGTACTDDCGGGTARVETGVSLTKGTHTLRVAGLPFDLSVTFTVPSIVSDGSLCASMDE